MLTDVNQRWDNGKARWRPAGELIRTSEYAVAKLPDDTTAKRFVLQHHYSGTFPAARWRFGLYRRGELVGTSVFSQPSNNKTLAIFPGAPIDSVELGRFVLLDSVPGNGETWFLARCFEQLRADNVIGVVSFSDPIPRTTAHGEVVFPGHVGTIYQAFNGRFLGRGTARTLKLLPDGRVMSARAMQKIRARERGWKYAAGILEAVGAEPLGEEQDARAWLNLWMPRLTRPLRHPRNLRYAWTLQRAHRRHLPMSQPYPKLADIRAEQTAAALAA